MMSQTHRARMRENAGRCGFLIPHECGFVGVEVPGNGRNRDVAAEEYRDAQFIFIFRLGIHPKRTLMSHNCYQSFYIVLFLPHMYT